ncbi:alpha/beta hydrolase [Actinoplanes sp. URMC 104]|uniref:alpha/beta hydrolase n=1 Tax=Actinoplanes sp. URMC 104 TaxID=3423409 RepID=UPI003F1ABE71
MVTTSRVAVPRLHYTFVGLSGALLFLCVSLTPSLLPRGWLFQGLISGALAAIGYGVAEFGGWVARWVLGRPPWPGASRLAWRVLGGVAAVLILLFWWLGAGWQRQIHRLMSLDPPPRVQYLPALLLAAVLFVALIAVARLVRRGYRALRGLLSRVVSPSAARALSVALVAAVLYLFTNGVLVGGMFRLADGAFATVNSETQPGVAEPQSKYRSGGPGSLMSWASLGNQGRKFIGSGPDEAELRAFSGRAPMEPIRVYAGLDAAPTPRERAELAVRELVRTGAFSREVLCLVTTTGTGWVNADAVDPLEYMYNGDTALVSMQYSYLPSVISFLVDQERARAAGRALVDEVYGMWSRLPVENRPKLLVFGESLGSFGSEAAFSGSGDIRSRVDGMLLAGPPNSNELWRQFVRDRDAGTLEVLPQFERGETVRFAADPVADLAQPPAPWGQPKVIYLQHPSDPITWWSPRLAVSRPDWLEERRGDDVLPAVQWYPLITWAQVSADMAISNNVPAGHGHRFGAAPVTAWSRIAPPDGWTPERTAALTALIADRPHA